MDNKDLQNLIRFVAKAGVSEVRYKTKDYEIHIKNPTSGIENIPFVPTMPTPVQISTPTVAENSTITTPTENSDKNESKYVTIKSPMIGTFYRKPAPDKDNFINVGDEVSSSSIVCVIEAMKLFNQIEAEISGKIVKVLVDDASPVEYDQPLFLVDPS